MGDFAKDTDVLISRQAAIESLGEEPEVWTGKDEYEMGLNNQWHYDRNAIMTVPAQERKRGKWIEYVNSHCECPFCHKEWSFFENMTEWFNYCPNCGAEMKGEE